MIVSQPELVDILADILQERVIDAGVDETDTDVYVFEVRIPAYIKNKNIGEWINNAIEKLDKKQIVVWGAMFDPFDRTFTFLSRDFVKLMQKFENQNMRHIN